MHTPYPGEEVASPKEHKHMYLQRDSFAGLTLALTWPPGEIGGYSSHLVAAKVNGDVRLSWQIHLLSPQLPPRCC
jgi:hypothetical protein